MTLTETSVCGDRWFATILKIDGAHIIVQCFEDWNQFLVQSSYINDWNVDRALQTRQCSRISLTFAGNIPINLLVSGNGFVIYPKSNPNQLHNREIELYYPPLFVIRPTITARSGYDINKFIYKYIGRELLRRDSKLNQNDIDALISREAEEYSWCCQYRNGLKISCGKSDYKPHDERWTPKESQVKSFLGKWYRQILEKQIEVWGASMDWGRGAWYTLKTLQTKPWKVPITVDQLKILANYYGLKITEAQYTLHSYAILFQSTFNQGNSYIEGDQFDLELIENNFGETDLVVIRKEGMSPIVTWRHCKTWHDLTISFFSSSNSPEVSLISDSSEEFLIVEKLQTSDGAILQGPAGSGKSTLLVRLATAIDSVGSRAVSMAYTGKAVKVLNNKGIEASTIHSFLHTYNETIIGQYWPNFTNADVKPIGNDPACLRRKHSLTMLKLVETRCDNYMDIREFERSGMFELMQHEKQKTSELYLKQHGELIAKLRDTLYHPYVIVDEASMLGARMLFMLLVKILELSKCLTKPIKVVLVGDKDQLPPVKDLNIFEILQKICPTIYLTKVHRIGNSGPLYLSQKCITSGISGNDVRTATVNGDVTLTKFATTELAQYSEFMKHHDNIFISPYKKLTQEINCAMTNGRSNQTGMKKWAIGDKVMVTSNMSDADVVNGDMGTVIATSLMYDELKIMRSNLGYIKVKDKPINCVFIYVHGSNRGAVLYGQSEINNLTHGYCVTIHKSQGSEWKNVFVCLQGINRVTFFLNRNILYTAITRTQHRLYIAGSVDVVSQMSTNRQESTRSLIDYYNGIMPKQIQNSHCENHGLSSLSMFEDSDMFGPNGELPSIEDLY